VDVASIVEIKVEPGVGEAEKKKKAAKKSDNSKKQTLTCKYCGLVGHQRRTNKDCLLTTNCCTISWRMLEPHVSLSTRRFIYTLILQA
jgi:hypothetical protein